MISRRHLELATALLTGAFGAAVAISSLDNGIGWSSAGVDAGTFPFITGLIILAGSLFNLLQGLAESRIPMLGTHELRRIGGFLLPALVYVGAIPLAGMYVASGAYVLGVLMAHQRISFLRAAIMAAATVIALYVLFERMFQVSLPHGALGAALGF
jgi:hypothetical protein